MTFTIESRLKALKDILVDLKSKLDAEENRFVTVSFCKSKLNGFKFKIALDCEPQPWQYDKYLEMKTFASTYMMWLANPETIDVMTCEEKFETEIEIEAKM